MKKEDLIKQIHEDPTFKSASKDLHEEDIKKIDASLNAFFDQMMGTVAEELEKAFNDPQVLEELKKRLRNNPK